MSFFLNTPQLLNKNRFDIWQDRFRFFIQSINHELWETMINGLFIPNHQVNGKLVDKPNSFWTKEENRKSVIDFKTKRFITMSLDYSKFYYVHPFNTAKEICDTLEIVNGVSLSIEQEKMNTRGGENEDTTFSCFSKFRNVREIILEHSSLTNL